MKASDVTPALLRQLRDEVTPGEWVLGDRFGYDGEENTVCSTVTTKPIMRWFPTAADARFVMAAHAAMPALLDRLAELESRRR